MSFATDKRNGILKDGDFIGYWILLFLACVLVYFPGLGGPFVFDDFSTIDDLGNFGGVRDWETFRAFVFGGTAGPVGRPLAMLSFLIDGNNWPAEPWSFKRTNLVIHMMNGALLGVLIGRLLQLLALNKRDRQWVTLLAVAVWLLHPFLVSTTLYVVQRMAQLSTLFIFLGLIGHLYGRSSLAKNRPKAYLIMTFSVMLFTLLAVLSKENGILLPILIGVLESTVLASQRERVAALDRRWCLLFIVAPSIIILSYLGVSALRSDFFNIVPPRNFSLYERALTQPRILLDYLQHWFVPKLYTTGVFQDHFIKSTGLLAPLTTLLTALFHIALIALSIVNRRKWPLFSLAALFFYASHLLESSVLNLELYFEHRNYLAAAFLFLPPIVLLRTKINGKYFVATAVVIVLILGSFTRYSATVWQDFSSMVEASAKKAPTSARAQAEYAKGLYNVGHVEDSLDVIDRAISIIPNDNPHLLMMRITMLCNLNILPAVEFDRVAKLMSATLYDPRLISIYFEFATAVVDRKCTDVTLDALRNMFANMLDVPLNADKGSTRYPQIMYIVGYVDVFNGKPAQAVVAFEASLNAQADAATAMTMSALLATKRYFEQALYVSNFALQQLKANPHSVLRGTSVAEADIREFQVIVRADMSRAPADDTSGVTP